MPERTLALKVHTTITHMERPCLTASRAQVDGTAAPTDFPSPLVCVKEASSAQGVLQAVARSHRLMYPLSPACNVLSLTSPADYALHPHTVRMGLLPLFRVQAVSFVLAVVFPLQQVSARLAIFVTEVLLGQTH